MYASPGCVYIPESISDNTHELKIKMAMTDIIMGNS